MACRTADFFIGRKQKNESLKTLFVTFAKYRLGILFLRL